MSKAEETTAEAPKKSKKKLLIMLVALVVVLGGAGGAFVMMSGKSEAAEAPEKGTVVSLEDPLTINLADGHYLKVGFAIQQTVDGEEELDTAEAIDIAIDTYTGMSVGDLATVEGRESAKEELLKGIDKAYNTKDKKIVMDVYFTSFVTQ